MIIMLQKNYKVFKKHTIVLLISILAFFQIDSQTQTSVASAQFLPLPFQDEENGRNSHAYLGSTNPLSAIEREQFIQQIIPYAMEANERWGIPASAIIGIAIIESGYGTTRIAHFANNLFGIKAWGINPINAWQLVGQPDEDFDQPVPILASYGLDRHLYDESVRRDNWYRKFDSYQEAVHYLAGTLLQNNRYGFARIEYEARLQQDWSLEADSKEYVYNIAHAGYNHLGGEYYRNRVGVLIDQWDLTQYDKNEHTFIDINKHWAKLSIEGLAKLDIISGFPDRTFGPDEPITREQFIKMLVISCGIELFYGKSTYIDVHLNHWSNPFIEAAVERNIIVNVINYSQFLPKGVMTRQEMAEYAARALALKPVLSELPFHDKQSIDNTMGLIGAATKHGFIQGFEDKTFRPSAALTRAQAVVVIERILNYISFSSS